ncbi:hypothetical protein, partial [Aquabacterium sp.]|uniref:hypothetical protein n=1 Tax=Aquabacterium sp. TaxID=1872578 RepID=UPI002C9C74ED
LVALAPAQARDWHRSALQAWRERGDAQAATELLMRAFAANPLDAEITGDLAWLRLRGQALQADGARQLALHALTLPHARHPYGRVDDWTTLAIASALTGRQRDAGNAWLVAAALTSNFDQLCRTAGQAYGRHGDRLRPSIDALQGCWRGGTRVSSDAGR